MDKTIYWAILLTKTSKDLLLEKCKPSHPNIYAEHITVVFNPTPEQDKTLIKQIGMSVIIAVTGVGADDKGQAVVVAGDRARRLGGGIPHITISCSDGTKPFYSNKLLDGGWDFIEPFMLYGNIARYTKNGWDTKSPR